MTLGLINSLTTPSVDHVPVSTLNDLALEHSVVEPASVAVSVDEKRQKVSQTKRGNKMRPNPESVTARYAISIYSIAHAAALTSFHLSTETSVHKIGVQHILTEQHLSSNTIMTTKFLPNLERFASNIKWDLCLCSFG